MYTTPPSRNTQQTEISSTDIRQLCQLQVDRLSKKLPVLDVWLVCWNHLENKRDTLSYRRNRGLDLQFKSYLESERWISENLPFLELMPLSLNSDESQVYVCGLGKADAHWNYLLLWTKQHFSHLQQGLVKKYAQLLQKYLILYQENLRQRAKIQLLEQTLQQAEHQLRNPLSLISLYAKNIGLGAENEIQKQQALCINRAAQQISSNLGDLLNFGQQAKMRRDHHDLLALLRNVLPLLTPALEAKQLNVVQPEKSVGLVVAGWQIEQVLQNLLDNAIHFSPVGGTITVNWQVAQQAVLIGISDQGPGLGDVNSDDVFTPFFSKRSNGTGLGLAIAKKIVLDHQGRIDAETLPRGGAKFSVYLPR
ncbi:MAG: HAMP domain-containing sensor histidine kinase [Cyanobacteria bacterium P01_C01_bin.118]